MFDVRRSVLRAPCSVLHAAYAQACVCDRRLAVCRWADNWRYRPQFHSLMLQFYSFTFVLLLACAAFFNRAGVIEGSSAIAWAAVSILISVAIWHWLHLGFVGVLLGRVGLFVAIRLYRSRKKP